MATGMPAAPWRTGIQAAFRGATFHIEVGGQAGGRRNVTHEFPERDVPFTEDMGRRARRWAITGYIVCSPTQPNYITARDALIAACEASSAGTLIHPTLGTMQVCCDTYSVSETRERGGMATFDMHFVEAGSIDGTAATTDTQSVATSNAATLGQTAATSLDTATQSSLADSGGVVST